METPKEFADGGKRHHRHHSGGGYRETERVREKERVSERKTEKELESERERAQTFSGVQTIAVSINPKIVQNLSQ